MSLDSGKLRHRLILLFLAEDQDSDTGEMVESWEEYDTVWGSFEPYSTKDVLLARSAQEQSSARAVIRYKEEVTSGMRVSFRSRLYKIDGPPLPDPESGNEYMTLMLSEIVDV